MSSRRRVSRTRVGLRYAVAGIVAVAAVAVVAAVLFAGGGSDGSGSTEVPAGYAYPVQAVTRIEDRTHFPVGQAYSSYTSDPPTSGPHAAAPANWGISDVAVAREMAVHNMEHAGVVVWYNCNAAPILSGGDCTQLRNDLGGVVQAAIGNGKRVLMTPYAGMDQRIALTAWGFLDAFDEFDAARVKDFIDTFECNYDPEHFCG